MDDTVSLTLIMNMNQGACLFVPGDMCVCVLTKRTWSVDRGINTIWRLSVSCCNMILRPSVTIPLVGKIFFYCKVYPYMAQGPLEVEDYVKG